MLPMEAEDAATSGDAGRGNPQLRPILMTVFLAFMGQMLLNPIIAPLSRQMGLQDWHIGATISLNAVMLALSSPYWGRASQRHGVKRVLVVSLIGSFVALALFAITSYLGMRGMWQGVSLVFGVLITRGLLYGVSISAVTPTAQAYLVGHADTEPERVRMMGALGAAQGISAICGGILGGVLAALGGLMLPLVAMPLMVLITIGVFAAAFKPQPVNQLIEQPAAISYFDKRVFPYLASGFCIFLVFSAVQTLFGFTVQDRFSLGPDETASVTAIYMVTMAVVMAAVQGGVVPKLRWPARRLLRVGLLVLLVSVICLWPMDSHALLAVATVGLGAGLGMAMTGYNTGPTLELDLREQGGLAGLISANNGATYAIAPVLATSLYGWNHSIPFIGIIVLIAGSCLYVWAHPQFRRAEPSAEMAGQASVEARSATAR